MSLKPPPPRRVRIIAQNAPTVARTGLRVGVVVEVLSDDSDPRLWVKCPEFDRRERNQGRAPDRRVATAIRRTKTGWVRRLWCDGYCTLEPREYEEI